MNCRAALLGVSPIRRRLPIARPADAIAVVLIGEQRRHVDSDRGQDVAGGATSEAVNQDPAVTEFAY